jgi:hypothetical protein
VNGPAVEPVSQAPGQFAQADGGNCENHVAERDIEREHLQSLYLAADAGAEPDKDVIAPSQGPNEGLSIRGPAIQLDSIT